MMIMKKGPLKKIVGSVITGIKSITNLLKSTFVIEIETIQLHTSFLCMPLRCVVQDV